MPDDLKQGSIILARLDDHHGKLSKHFAVVLTKTEDILKGDDLAVAGISTSFRMPLPSNWLALNSKPGVGDKITKLRAACVVKADWLNVIKQSDVIMVRGRVLAKTMSHLLHLLPK